METIKSTLFVYKGLGSVFKVKFGVWQVTTASTPNLLKFKHNRPETPKRNSAVQRESMDTLPMPKLYTLNPKPQHIRI